MSDEDDISENEIIVFGPQREIQRWKKIVHNCKGTINLNSCIQPPASLIDLPLNSMQSALFGLEDWKKCSWGCLPYKSRPLGRSANTFRYMHETKHGNMTKFIYTASRAFGALEFTLAITTGHEKSRYYIKQGEVIVLRDEV
jgi:hypothetical protein